MAQEGATFEVIVVDDGSPEPLAPVCKEFGPMVRCIRRDNGGPAGARNAGVRAARASFVAFTDDDCRPQPDWLRHMMAAHGGDATRLVGGQVENALSDNIYSATSQLLCDYLYDYFGAEDGDMPFFTSNNMACSRTAYERLGGFDETFPLAAAEDRDFGLRWRASGGDLTYVPGARVGHAHKLSFRRFLRQHANYGRGARHLHRLMQGRGDRRPPLESILFYLRLLTYPIERNERAALPKSALMAMTQVAMVYGYFSERTPNAPAARRKPQKNSA